ncbi:hypothetical protein Poli38472_000660 [Pythium oligandrum]|uniref:Uncharacterized protein n=1 Tax=Pythium oligandrum TaxID=41045 RepID=A0A8K1CCR4_PYTOL|nr:hypothetical protein Poli38472_000660 [Pythium oligandrum]|eukprot:TMW60618.1 hypothetical protein Poli38472_000660 [Pythium oligandrum]
MTTRYADPQAYERYEEFDGQEGVVTQLVPVSSAEAFDAWIEKAWKKPMVKELRPGQGRGHVGHFRQVPLGIKEEILSAGLPREEDDEVIPTILYKVQDFGPMPVNDHIGFVRFVPDKSSSKPQTLVIWTIKIVPSTIGNVFFCGGSVIRVFIRTALSFFLSDVNSYLKKKVNRP